MKNKLRKFLFIIDYQLYLIKWRFNIYLCTFLLKYEKNNNKRDKLIYKIIGEPFYSKWQLPYPNTMKYFESIKNEN